MRIVCISDTHSLHKGAFDKSPLPEGDLLLCAGDITNQGDEWDVFAFAKYFKDAPFKHKITIAGNHDFCFERANRKLPIKELKEYGWTYLEDEAINIDGLRIYGSPWQPEFFDWAFNLPREALAEKWARIPADTDILITHGPAHGILDFTERDQINVGCEDLLKRVIEIKPMLHLFGHIHEGYGYHNQNGVHFVNASICTLNYKPTNKPFVFDFDPIVGELTLINK